MCRQKKPVAPRKRLTPLTFLGMGKLSMQAVLSGSGAIPFGPITKPKDFISLLAIPHLSTFNMRPTLCKRERVSSRSVRCCEKLAEWSTTSSK